MLIPGVRAHDYGKNTPNGLFGQIGDDGWQTVQLAFKKAVEGADGGITPQMVDDVKAAAEKSGVSVGVLGAYIEPSLADEEQRQKQVQAFCGQIPFAAALSAKCIGTETTNMQKQPGVSREDALKQLRRSVEKMLTVAEEHRVFVGVEPVFYHAMNTPEEVRALLKDMQSPWLRVIYDPVNILSPDLVNTQHDLWKRAIDCFGESIAAMHFKGVRLEDGQMVAAPLEESVVDYDAVFAGVHSLGLTRDIPVLREEAVPEMAEDDLEFMEQFL